MKRIYTLFLAGVLFVGCKDQIDAPQTASGEKIVFTTIDYSNPDFEFPNAVVVDSDGTNSRSLGPGFIFNAGVDRMLWVTDEQFGKIVISDAMGGNRKEIAPASLLGPNEELYGFGIALSPDGSRFTYSVRDTSGDSQNNKYLLYLINADGTGKRLLCDTFYRETALTFSPDGKKIAYYRKFDDGHSLDAAIEIQNVDGTNRYLLTPITGAGVDGYGRIAWSAKDRIAYTESGKLNTINVDGSNKILVADRGEAPAWSPTGDTLAFGQNGGDGDIFMTTDYGLTLTNLTNTPGIWDSYPAWSHEGGRIVFTSWIGDYDQTLLTLREVDIKSATSRIIASPGAHGFYMKY